MLMLLLMLGWLLFLATFVDAVQVLQVLIEGATTVYLIVGDVLDEDFLDVRRRQVCLLEHDIFPAKLVGFEECMLFDLSAIVRTGTKSLSGVPI